MALNCAMIDDYQNPVPLPHEVTITSVDSGVDLTVKMPSSSPSGSGSSLKATGRLWVTDQRVLFISKPKSSFESLSVPLHSILSTKFMQPTFGANYLTFEAKPAPEGGLKTGTEVEVRFKGQAMFQFVALLEKTRERAIYMKRQMAQDEDVLPRYDSPAQSSSVVSPSNDATVPVENPPAYGA
ncbi:uncharacterized protein BT62DRAFT_947825 [Guyanagaster necrorhizus]|uniref:WW domain-binding protein 2 n=1 Tax=Guyanagaster necrorhizus TaxID=856835 RepID=A0A9P8ATY1_9AGAR|nr:uncharacterized protein BT62DRAFT_947825 [Guyanagaster necrorhizus MCA 3950]KAG7447695.1 hypothetical protein BT62DRAFT_947825 [Guyanagaster necrorhizus MCA 3950]